MMTTPLIKLIIKLLNYDLLKSQDFHYFQSFVSTFCLSVVLGPYQTAGIWLCYTEGKRAEGWRLPN